MHSKEHFLDIRIRNHVKQLRNRKGFPQTKLMFVEHEFNLLFSI